MSQWADINWQSCKVCKCIAKTQDESLLTSKMIIALTESITTFGFCIISVEVVAELAEVNRRAAVTKTGRQRGNRINGFVGKDERDDGKCVSEMDLEYRAVMPPPPCVII